MKNLKKPLIYLLLFEILIITAGFFLTRYVHAGLSFTEIVTISGGFTLITLITLLIFFRGQKKDPSSQTMHSLVAISLKLIIELIFAFAWIFISKNTGLAAVLLFFVLYLSFTMFTVFVILKTLKKRSI